ncbi:Fic/DOC family protein [Brevibacterium sanguinis]|uniref:Fic/DOC family protein n=2 Tax=Brevibacterium TaxID=1696 RepID=A0A366IER1_9MICO|nr:MULTISPECIES: Fic family protein [Brevibacterium]RBP63395.1 Fic/DOC family protein [Brevibacterium sanguinis]RBP69862.1 Fic/DOC family protein [Brevibacterium celere]
MSATSAGSGGPGEAVLALSRIDEVAAAVTRARSACTELRWHNALRKRIPEAAAEATVRAARSSAALEGARYPTNFVREVIAGREVPDDLSGTQLAAAVRVAAYAAELSAQAHPLRGGLLRVLSTMSVAAGAGLVDDDRLGRPRLGDEMPGDLGGLPAPPPPAEVVDRLRALEDILAEEALPGLVVAALLHGEILALRPFAVGNGLIARALFRIHLVTSGVDPTGVAVPEAAFLDDATGYGQAGNAYAAGRDVPGFIVSCAQAVEKGAGEGQAICRAVQAGRLPRSA